MSSYDKIKPSLGLETSGPHQGHTRAEKTEGCKQIGEEFLPAVMTPTRLKKHKEFSPHVAPESRVFTNDYSKVTPEKDDIDEVGPVLGPPLRW